MGLLSMQHPSHNQQQGPSPSQQHPQLSRPSSVVHTQAHPSPQQRSRQTSQQHPVPQPHHQPPSQHQNAYSHAYPAGNQHGANPQDSLNYYGQPSPYSTQSATSGYQSADTSDMMAAAQIPRHHYPPMSYHTPQSNSPASVASPSQHDQHRSMYGPPPPQHMPPSMYYQPPPQYQPMPQTGASPYAQHAQHPPQTMTSQPNMMMSHPAPQNQMASHPQHAPQHAQPGMTASPRPKMESQVPLQLQKQPSSSSLSQNHHQQQQPNGNQMQSPGNSAASINPNAAPGPIPATTPLVVRQDGNGVQWIAFEYSRDRVKMEYTIRCDVESVNIDELSPDFKQENCVYPRACCPKDQYRGNRLVYETECNRVGWALAQLNMSLRGKRGLIQRAVDSWRNSNQDPRLRSRRVRRMAKMTNRNKASMSPHPSNNPHMPGAPPGAMPGGPGSMGHSTPSPGQMGKPTMGGIGQAPGMHHHPGAHHDGPHQNGDHVANGTSFDGPNHHQTATHGPNGDVRQNHVFTEYGTHGYPAPAPGPHMSHMAPHSGAVVTAMRGSRYDGSSAGLFPSTPEATNRTSTMVQDDARAFRGRSRMSFGGVDTKEIPGRFRNGSRDLRRSSHAREMQTPTPSATPSFFAQDTGDDRVLDTEGRRASRRGRN